MAAEIRGHDVGARVGLAVLLDKMESASSTRVPEAGALRRARGRGQRKECRDRPALQPGKVDNQCVEKIPPVVFRWMERGPPTVGRYPGTYLRSLGQSGCQTIRLFALGRRLHSDYAVDAGSRPEKDYFRRW